MNTCSFCMKRLNKSQHKISCCKCHNCCHLKCANVVISDQMVNNVIDDWFCPICIQQNLPFSNTDDEDLEILFSGLTEESFRIYKTCKRMNFETITKLNSNKFNFDKDINPDSNFYDCNIDTTCKYYSDEELNITLKDSSAKYGFSIIHFNCRSLVAHFTDIQNFLKNIIVKFDVIALSETWIIPDQHDLSDFNYEGYTMYTTSRTVKHGGGVALYVNENLECDVIGNISKVIENCMETVFVNLTLKTN